jgi:hypothetical protein
MNRLTSYRFWAHGLIAAAIGGGANAVTLIVVDPLKFNLQDGWRNLLTAVLVSGLVAAALYLKQSPLPEVKDEDGSGSAKLGVFVGVLLLFLLNFTSGCTTIKQADAQQIDTAAASIKFAVSQGLSPVLANNPEYVPAVQALSAGVSGVLLLEGGVTDVSARAFVAGIALKQPLDAKTQAIMAGVIVDAYQFYVDAYKPKVAASLDPNAAKLIAAFQAGVAQAVARASR